jgi:SanA protein
MAHLATPSAGTRKHAQRMKMKIPAPWFKRAGLALLGMLAMAALAIAWANIAASWAARGRTFGSVDATPPSEVGLVFGTSDRTKGRENLYFKHRVEAAAALWKAGKIRTLIVSGDNRAHDYNEPEKMKRALVRLGVPAQHIVCDYAGLRTLDSVVRAKKIFGLNSILFISQRFQNQRAIYIAKAHGLDAIAHNARDVGPRNGFKTRLREIGARVKMWLDVNILDTKPKHLGDRIGLPE